MQRIGGGRIVLGVIEAEIGRVTEHGTAPLNRHQRNTFFPQCGWPQLTMTLAEVHGGRVLTHSPEHN